MNESLQLVTPFTHKRGLTLILTHDRARQSKTDLIAHLLLKGPLFVVSGDEWLPSFSLPRILRSYTTDVQTVARRFPSVRSSTCYRLLDSLASIPSQGEPILVMDFLHTFYEEDIPLRTRLFMLRECCRELTRLAFYRPMLVMIQERQGDEYEKLFPALSPLADKTITLEHEIDSITQPMLF